MPNPSLPTLLSKMLRQNEAAAAGQNEAAAAGIERILDDPGTIVAVSLGMLLAHGHDVPAMVEFLGGDDAVTRGARERLAELHALFFEAPPSPLAAVGGAA